MKSKMADISHIVYITFEPVNQLNMCNTIFAVAFDVINSLFELD